MLKGPYVDTLWGRAMPSMDTERLNMSFCYEHYFNLNPALRTTRPEHHDLERKP